MDNPVQVSAFNKYVTATWELGQDDTGEAVAFSQYSDKTVQAFGDFEGGTVTIEGSMDNDTFAPLTDVEGGAAVFDAAGMLVLRENPQYIRVVSSDTASLDVTVIIGCAEVL